MFKLKGSERGQSIIIVALIMVVLIALIALVIDIGFAYAKRRHLQNVADAAALAGTLEYCKVLTWDSLNCSTNYTATCGKKPTHSAIRAAAAAYVLSHDDLVETDIVSIDYVTAAKQLIPVPEDVLGMPPTNYTGVQVKVGKQFDTFFAGVIGRQIQQASAVARDVVKPGISGGDEVPIIPIVIDDDILEQEKGKKYCFWKGPQGDPEEICPEGTTPIPLPDGDDGGDDDGGDDSPSPAPGNWGWLTWNQPDTGSWKNLKEGSLCHNIIRGYNGQWQKYDMIPGNTGIVAAAEKCLEERMNIDPEVLIPVYDWLKPKETGNPDDPAGGANAEYHTIELVTFHLDTPVLKDGNEKYIVGTYIDVYVPCDGCSSSGDDTGPILIGSARPIE